MTRPVDRRRAGAVALRPGAVDLGVLALLTSVGGLPLIPVYGTAAPLLAMAIGSLVAALTLLAAARLRVPAVPAAAAALVLVLSIGPLVIAGGRWSPSGLRLLLRGSVTGWRDVLTVQLPIGDTGDLLVPPLLIGAVAMIAAGLIAGSRRHPLALVPVALAYVVAALIGASSGVDGGVAVQAGIGLAVGLGWLSWRQKGRVRSTGSWTARWGRPAIAVALLAVAGLVAAAIGGSTITLFGHQQDRLALRTGVSVPIDPRSVASPLSGFRSAVKQDPPVTAFDVTGVQPGDRLRLAALDAYDGQLFSATADEGPFARIGQQVARPSVADPLDPARPAAGTPRTVQVRVASAGTVWAPVLGELTSVSFRGDRTAQLADGFRYSAAAATGLLPAGWHAGDTLLESVVVPAAPSAAQLANARPAPVGQQQTSAIPDALRVAAARYAGSGTTAGEQLVAIAHALATGGYFSDGRTGQLRSPSGHGLDRLLGMVSGPTMAGDQEQYAALMAVLARALGIPARLVVGYQVPAGAAGTVALTGTDLTAWVEAPFQGWGWVAFDPTPPRTRTTVDQLPQAQAGRHVTDNVPPPSIAGADSATVQPGERTQQPAAAAPSIPAPAAVAARWPWWAFVVLSLVALAVILALPAVTVLLVKRIRRRRRQSAVAPGARARAAWRELIDVAVDAGFRPPPSQTRAETAALLAISLPVPAGPTARLAAVADAAQFAPVALSDDVAGAQWQTATESAAELLRSIGRRGRWRARLSVASLRPGAAG